MTVTGFGNLAVKVSDLDAAVRFYEESGAVVGIAGRGTAVSGRCLLRTVQITMFTRALHEDAVPLPDDCFLHLAMFTHDVRGNGLDTGHLGAGRGEGHLRARTDRLRGGARGPALLVHGQLDDPPGTHTPSIVAAAGEWGDAR